MLASPSVGPVARILVSGSLIAALGLLGACGAFTGSVADSNDPVEDSSTDDASAESPDASTNDAKPPIPGDFIAKDDFEREVATGWGNADVGGAWEVASTPDVALSVADGKGVITLPTEERGARVFLAAGHHRDTDEQVTVTSPHSRRVRPEVSTSR